MKKIIAGLVVFTMLCGVAYADNGVVYEIVNSFSVSAETLNNGLTYEIIKGGTEIEITNCDKTITEIEIPSKIDGLPVTSIGKYVFSNCELLTKAIIPDSVENIDWAAFSNCKLLTEIVIPDSVKWIGQEAFYKCESLTKVIMSDSIVSVGLDAFSGTPLLENQTTDVKYVGKCAISCNQNASAVEIRPDTICIAYFAFCDCKSLTEITIPDCVKNIGYQAFSNCTSLTKVTIYDSVTNIDIYSLGYYLYIDENEYTCDYLKVDNFTIYGVKGSAAETYAIENEFNFVEIEKPKKAGDVDNDDKITSFDALILLQTIVGAADLTEEQKKLADLDGDGEVTSSDALIALQIVVGFR